MKWQNKKITLSDSPARDDIAIHHSSATHSPKIPDKTIENKADHKTHHQHRWTIITSHWQCEICGRTYR